MLPLHEKDVSWCVDDLDPNFFAELEGFSVQDHAFPNMVKDECHVFNGLVFA